MVFDQRILPSYLGVRKPRAFTDPAIVLIRGAVVVVIVWWLDFQLPVPVQSVPITTNVVSSNLVHGEVYSIQHYVIKFVSDLR
jgi:hypothetical protein